MSAGATPPRRSIAELEAIARELRLNVVEQVRGRNEGYLGQGLQCADIFAVLYFAELHWSPELASHPDRDRLLLSVGHYAIILYAALAAHGIVPDHALASYGVNGSDLTQGAEPGVFPGVEFAGGSLGQGLGVACGLAWSLARRNSPARVFNYLSDGELQEGATWEAAMVAGHLRLGSLTNLVDVNRTQSDGALVVEVEPVAEKFRSFGWWADDVDGHDIAALLDAFATARAVTDRPACLVLHTEIGHGSPTIARSDKTHFSRLDDAVLDRVAKEVAGVDA